MRNGLRKVFLLFTVVALSSAWIVARQPLPIKRVLLYKNGMAYLVRSGVLQEPVSLSFHPEDMKDILKSFTAWNPESGSLYSLGYTSGIPVAQLLSRFPFDLNDDGGGLAHFLAQIRGAPVRLSLGSTEMFGKILSLSQEQHAVDRQTLVPDHRLSILQKDGKVQTVWLSDVRSLELEDKELSEQLRTYLEVLAEGTQDTSREVTIYPVPDPGPVRVAYIEQFPVWKTGYRLELAGNDSRIQGWAQIDNPTGEAWEDVDLTLISGMPVSFIMDLYQPLYTSRTRVQVPGTQVAVPRSYEAVVKSKLKSSEEERETFRDEVGRRQTRAKMGEVLAAAEAPAELSRQRAAGFVQAEAAQIQDYYEYRFPFPVRIASRESALLPFLKKKISVESVSVFNPNSDRNHPQSGAWLQNNTGFPLEAGPITFFVEGRYAGEAVLEYVAREERRLVSYGLDQDVEVFREQSLEPETTVHLTINRGTVVFQKEQTQTTRYQLKNKARKEKTVLIEHPKRPRRELKNVEPLETTANFFRFQVKLESHQEREFPVDEIISRETRLSIMELNRRQLEVHFAGLRIPPSLRQQLDKVVFVREKLASLQGQTERLDQEIESIFRDQTRLRENLRSLGRGQEEMQLRQRYLSQMNQQEDRIEQLRRNRSDLTQQISEQESLLSSLISELSVSFDP